jgi:hypothetical protein
MGKDNIFICGNTRERYMTIEIAPKEYWKRLNYYDALLYLSILNIDGKEGWKLPSDNQKQDVWPTFKWTVEDGEGYKNETILLDKHWWVIPVRDI